MATDNRPTAHGRSVATLTRLTLGGLTSGIVTLLMAVSPLAAPAEIGAGRAIGLFCYDDNLALEGYLEIKSPSNPIVNPPGFVMVWWDDPLSDFTYESDLPVLLAQYEDGLLTLSLPLLDSSGEFAGYAEVTAALARIPGREVDNLVFHQGNVISREHLVFQSMTAADVSVTLPNGTVHHPTGCYGENLNFRIMNNHPRFWVRP